MQAPRSGEAGGVRRLHHAFRLGQALLGVFGREILQEALGAYAGPAREDALQMEGADVYGSGQFAQLGLLPEIGLQVPDGLFDTLVIAHGRGNSVQRRPDPPGSCFFYGGGLAAKMSKLALFMQKDLTEVLKLSK